jgi:hypothetical protein
VPLHDESPAAAEVRHALAHCRRRLLFRALARAAALTAPTGALVYLACSRGMSGGPAAAVSITLSLSGATLGLWRKRASWSSRSAAREMERVRPESHNVIVTAEELLRHPDRARLSTRARVVERAAQTLCDAAGARPAPLSRDVLLAAVSAVVAASAIAGGPQQPSSLMTDGVQRLRSVAAGSPARPAILATITPPAYAEKAPTTVSDPDRIDALEGSHLRLILRLEGERASWRVRFGADPVPASRVDQGLVIDMRLTRSGYLAIEPAESGPGVRRLLPLSVTPDRAPSIKVDAPGKDLLVPNTRTLIAVRASAEDDLGLQSLDLRYTRISGSGEQFDFQEGAIPVAIARESPRTWTARAELALERLALAPGDSVVYRFVGRDRRPGDAGVASSDTFFIEVAGPGQVALESFELPPDRERYAISQQMIVLKLERLRVAEPRTERTALEREVAGIAAEQRAVKSNFIFLTGGEVEDEEAEAEHSHEIQEGRLENTARREISAAIQFMTRTEQALAAVSTAAALPAAREAVKALQRAFGRNRYFLRALPVRSRIDPARRMTGDLTKVGSWRRELAPATPDAQAAAARSLLARILGSSAEMRSGAIDATRLTGLAEEALAAGPAVSEWQAISRRLLQLRDGPDVSADDRAKLVNETVAALAALIGRHALSVRRLDGPDAVLRGVWEEELRRR